MVKSSPQIEGDHNCTVLVAILIPLLIEKGIV
jgi:hypothetical protein